MQEGHEKLYEAWVLCFYTETTGFKGRHPWQPDGHLPVNCGRSSSNPNTLLGRLFLEWQPSNLCKKQFRNIYAPIYVSNRNQITFLNFYIFKPCSSLHASCHQKAENLGVFFSLFLINNVLAPSWNPCTSWE